MREMQHTGKFNFAASTGSWNGHAYWCLHMLLIKVFLRNSTWLVVTRALSIDCWLLCAMPRCKREKTAQKCSAIQRFIRRRSKYPTDTCFEASFSERSQAKYLPLQAPQSRRTCVKVFLLVFQALGGSFRPYAHSASRHCQVHWEDQTERQPRAWEIQDNFVNFKLAPTPKQSKIN